MLCAMTISVVSFSGVSVLSTQLVRTSVGEAVNVKVVLPAQRCTVELIKLIEHYVAGKFHPDELKQGRSNKRCIHGIIPSLQLFDHSLFRLIWVTRLPLLP